MIKWIYIHSFTKLFQNLFSNGFLQWKPQCYKFILQYLNILLKINSHSYITKTYHEGKQLPLGTFVPKRNFSHVNFFLTNLNPFGLDQRKNLTDYPMLHMNSFHKMVPFLTFIETTFVPSFLQFHALFSLNPS